MEGILKDIRDSVEVAKRVNVKWMTLFQGSTTGGWSGLPDSQLH